MGSNDITLRKDYLIIGVVIAAILIISLIIISVIFLRKSSGADYNRFEEDEESDQGNISLMDQCLKAHNNYRLKHGSPALQVDKELEKTALKVAKSNAEQRTMEHSNYGFGENLYEMQSTGGFEDFDCKNAVSMWYSEYKDYDFRSGEYVRGTGHFTQIVWKSSKYVGCASATSEDLLVVVCEYKPAGNVIGLFKENVLPKASKR